MKNYAVNKTWKFKVLTVLAIAVTLSLGFYMYRGNEVSLNVDGGTKTIISYSNTVEELLEKEGISLDAEGYINLALDTKLEDKMNIIIKNPKPYVIDIGGSQGDITSIHNYVGPILKDLGIELGEKDYTYPALDQKVSPGSIIELYQIKEVYEELESTIPFEKITNNSNKLDTGVTKVVQEGKEGLKKSIFKHEYINGELVSTILEEEEIIEEPIPHVVERGTKAIVATSRGDTTYRKAIEMTATAYDLSFESTGKRPGDPYYGITASGTKARPGVVAVDPRVIPLGTRLYVESLDGTKDYGFAIAEDKGGAIKGNKIDLFFETAREVRNFGRRKVKVYILKD